MSAPRPISMAAIGARELLADRLRREDQNRVVVPDSRSSVGACRVCRCTDDNACPGSCSWVTLDLCSCCAYEALPEPEREKLVSSARAVLLSTGVQSGCESCAGVDELAEMFVDPTGALFCRDCWEHPFGEAEMDSPRIVVP